MKERGKVVFLYWWKIIYPAFIYMGILNVLAFLIVLIFGESRYLEHATLISLFAMAFAIPWLMILFRKEKKQNTKYLSEGKKAKAGSWAVILTGSFVLALSLNLLIAASGLQERFPEYSQVAEQMYEEHGSIVLLAALIFAPITEELTFRGVCFLRIRALAGKGMTILLSGLLFGIYHMNLVQFVYAFLMGMFFAWLFERYRDVKLTVAAHAMANFCAIILSFSRLHF